MKSVFGDQVQQCKHFEVVYILYITECSHEGLENTYAKLRAFILAHLEGRRLRKVAEQVAQGPIQKATAGKGSSPNGGDGGCKHSSKGSRITKKTATDCYQFLKNNEDVGDNLVVIFCFSKLGC